MDWDDLEPKMAKAQGNSHVLGQDIAKLSIDELNALVDALKQEIARIEAAIEDKQSSKSQAEAAFKR